MPYHSPYQPQYEQDIWLRKKGKGKKQMLNIGFTSLILGLGMIGVGIPWYFLFKSDPTPFFGVGIGILLVSLIGFIPFFQRKYFIELAVIIFEKIKIPSNNANAFIDNFIESRMLGKGQIKKKRNGEITYFAYNKEVNIFIFPKNKNVMMIGIRDADGKNHEVIDDFIATFISEFRIGSEVKEIMNSPP